MGAEFADYGLCIIEQDWVVIESDHTDLLRRKPEREISSIMLDEESNEPLMGSKRGAMDAERYLFRIISITVMQAKFRGYGEVYLIRGDGELTTDGAPNLDINLGAIERSLIWHLDKIDSTFDQHATHHVFSFFPKLWLIHKLLTQLFWVVGRKSHLVFLEPEDLEVLEIHLIDRAEFLGELILGAIDMRVVHVE